MYLSLFFGEPSQAFYPLSQAKLYDFKNQVKMSLFFPSFVDTQKSHEIEFYDFNWDNKDPNKFLHK